MELSHVNVPYCSSMPSLLIFPIPSFSLTAFLPSLQQQQPSFKRTHLTATIKEQTKALRLASVAYIGSIPSTANIMSTTFEQFHFQANKIPTMPMGEYSFEPTFGTPRLPNRKIPLDHHASPYNQLLVRRLCLDDLRKTYAMAAKGPISYSKDTDEATKNANFLEFCSWEQIFRYTENEFDEWEREIALEEEVLYQRMTLDNSSFSKWIRNHDQCEFEYKLARNKTVLHNLDVKKTEKIQEHMAQHYREHTKLAEAESKQKDFVSTMKAQIQVQSESADQTKQLAQVEEQKGSSETMKPRMQSTDSTKRQEVNLPESSSRERDSPKARSKEDIRQEFVDKARLAASNCSPPKSASPLVSTSPLAAIAPSISVSASSRVSLPADPPLSTSLASTQPLLSTSAISPKASAGSPSSSGALPPSPLTEEVSQDSTSSGPASSRSLSTPCTTPQSTQQVLSPKASSAIVTPSKSPVKLTSSASAMPAQTPAFVTPPKSRGRSPPLSVRSAERPQPPSSAQFMEPRRRQIPPEWNEPLTLCCHVVMNMPYAPVKTSEAMIPPAEAILILPHTSVIRTLAAAMHVHPAFLVEQYPLSSYQSRPGRPELKEVEYLITGLRAWWHAIYPKPQTREAAFAAIKDRKNWKEPLRETFEMASKAEVKFMAWRVWRLVRERKPLVSLTDGAGETVRRWLGWERGELGFWD